jgi:hypothetical protein
MAETHVLSALRAKYDELLGQLDSSRRRTARLHDDLAHVEATIRMFDPEWDKASASAKRPHRPSRWAKRKEGVRLYLQALREAEEPLTARDIAERALRLGGYPFASPAALKAMIRPVTSALSRRPDFVERLPGRPARWRLQRTGVSEDGPETYQLWAVTAQKQISP